MRKFVRHTVHTLPPLSEAQRRQLKSLAVRPESEIDTSEIPVLSEAQWTNGSRQHFYRPRTSEKSAK